MLADTNNKPSWQGKWKRASIGLLIALGVCLLIAIESASNPAPGHAPFHVNCPPGSHGSNAWVGFGAKLAQSREGAIELRSSPFRAITAGHPQLQSGGQR